MLPLSRETFDKAQLAGWSLENLLASDEDGTVRSEIREALITVARERLGIR